MENVMTNAWEIARKGQGNFGGNVKEYFAQALKMAWGIFKTKGDIKMNNVKGIIKDFDLPKLEGTEKQVEWANQIRSKALAEMQHEVTHVTWEGKTKRSVETLVDALQSKEDIQNHLDNKPAFLVKRTEKSMNDLLDRYERMIEIGTNPSAKFWIDNRDNQEKNYMFIKFAEYVQTGLKEY